MSRWYDASNDYLYANTGFVWDWKGSGVTGMSRCRPGSSAPGSSRALFGLGVTTDNDPIFWYGQLATSGYAFGQCRDNAGTGGSLVSSTRQLVHSTWVDVGFATDGASDHEVYVDGASVATGSGALGSTTGADRTAVGTLVRASAAAVYWGGEIDECALWVGKLSDECHARYGAGVCALEIEPDQLAAYIIDSRDGYSIDIIGNRVLTRNDTPRLAARSTRRRPPQRRQIPAHLWTRARSVDPATFGGRRTLFVPAAGGGSLSVIPQAIASAEAFGAATISPGAVSVLAQAIASAQAFGSATVIPGTVTISPSGIAGAEAFGTGTVSVGALSLLPSGIGSAEAFGTLAMQPGTVTVQPAGIGTGEAYGATVVQPGAVILLPAGIATGELFGDQIVIPGAVVIQPSGVASLEGFGTLTLAGGAQLLSWLLGAMRVRAALQGAPEIGPAIDGVTRSRPALRARTDWDD